MKENLSPEEILNQRELEGGIEFDDNPLVNRIKENEALINKPSSSLGNINDKPIEQNPVAVRNSLGKVDNRIRRDNVELGTGWKNLPLEMLPSLGKYYPEGTQIAIRPAEVVEIRHFSTIDENDRIGTNSQFNYILDRCMRMQFPGVGVVDYSDIIQEDRFYIILAIRDLTFIKGENKIILKPNKKCEGKPACPFNDGFELNTGCLEFFEINPGIMKYYSPENRRFEFRLKDSPDEIIAMYIPTIGTKEKILEFKNEMNKRRILVDSSFMDILPFILPNHKEVNFDWIYSKYRESDYWSKEEFSLYFMLSSELKVGTKINAKLECPECHGEVKAPILFKNGIKSIFVISDILGQLL